MENILYERNVLEVIDKALELEKITFLLGSRQTGKVDFPLAVNHRVDP